MARVEVDIEDEDGADAVYEEPEEPRRGRRTVEVEREVTKRQLIQSISSIVIVVLYMLFTLLRDRDQGVTPIDPDDSADDWDETE